MDRQFCEFAKGQGATSELFHRVLRQMLGEGSEEITPDPYYDAACDLYMGAGLGDPSAPDMFRAYSLTFGVDITPRQSVAWGHEIVKHWLKTAKMTGWSGRDWRSPEGAPGTCWCR
jgi:hypothetical protein